MVNRTITQEIVLSVDKDSLQGVVSLEDSRIINSRILLGSHPKVIREVYSEIMLKQIQYRSKLPYSEVLSLNKIPLHSANNLRTLPKARLEVSSETLRTINRLKAVASSATKEPSSKPKAARSSVEPRTTTPMPVVVASSRLLEQLSQDKALLFLDNLTPNQISNQEAEVSLVHQPLTLSNNQDQVFSVEVCRIHSSQLNHLLGSLEIIQANLNKINPLEASSETSLPPQLAPQVVSLATLLSLPLEEAFSETLNKTPNRLKELQEASLEEQLSSKTNQWAHPCSVHPPLPL